MKNIWIACVMGVILISCDSPEKKREKYFRLANTSLHKKNYERAIELYSQALKWDKNHSQSFNNRAVAQAESDHIYEAILDYNQAILINSNYTDARLNRAYAYEKIGKYEKAMKDVDFLIKQKVDSAFLYFYKGIILVKTRNFEEALKTFKTSDILEPQNPETLINLANVFYLQNKLKEADSVLQKAEEIESNNPNSLNLASMIATKQENFSKALSLVNAALDTVPNDPYFLNNRGYILLKSNRLEEAIEDINKSILLNNKNGWAYRNKGIYYYKNKEYKLAQRLFEKASKSVEFVDDVYSYLGKTYQKLEQNEKACFMWKQGIERKEAESKQLFEENCN